MGPVPAQGSQHVAGRLNLRPHVRLGGRQGGRTDIHPVVLQPRKSCWRGAV
jgi:hypothetical protein